MSTSISSNPDVVTPSDPPQHLAQRPETLAAPGQLALGEFEQIFQEAPDGIIVTSRSGIIEHANRYVASLFGYTLHELIGRNVSILIPHPEQDRHDAHIAQLSVANNSGILGVRREVRGQHRDGRIFPLDLRVMPLQAEGSLRYVGLVSDISERKQLEHERRMHQEQLEIQNAELRRLQSLAESASRAKSEFLANISHEIRTPLTAILGFAEHLLEPDIRPQERWEDLQTIRRNGRHLLQLINDVLDLSKIESGQFQIRLAACDLRSLMDDLQATFSPLANERGLTFDVLPLRIHPPVIQSDSDRLRQILYNLLSNAFKFTERGGVTLSVEDGRFPASPRRRVQFRVTDTGPGMGPDLLARLFRPFTQGDASATRPFGGTGLGLTISRNFARLMGGDIRVTSQVGTGSIFTVGVDAGPLDAERPTDKAGSRPVTPAPLTSAATRPPLSGRILLAEDAPDIRRLLMFQLTKFGLEVVSVNNGAEAVEAALSAAESHQPFDVVLMDMQMPVMDGYQATATIRRAGYLRPVIAVTANALSGDREKCLAAGCDEFLSKPIDFHQLHSLLRCLLSERSPTVSNW